MTSSLAMAFFLVLFCSFSGGEFLPLLFALASISNVLLARE